MLFHYERHEEHEDKIIPSALAEMMIKANYSFFL